MGKIVEILVMEYDRTSTVNISLKHYFTPEKLKSTSFVSTFNHHTQVAGCQGFTETFQNAQTIPRIDWHTSRCLHSHQKNFKGLTIMLDT